MSTTLGRKTRVILNDIGPDDYTLAARVIRYSYEMSGKDAILVYGEGHFKRTFYVRKNKTSTSVWRMTDDPPCP